MSGAKVLLVGESWFLYTVHQKGFDAFYNSSYEEAGQEFLACLRQKGHSVTHIPAHQIESRFPRSLDDLSDVDIVVISDVGANTFQLPMSVFHDSKVGIDTTEVLREYVAQGGGLLMVGGYLSFSGIDAKARWGHSPLAAALPVTVLDRDDRVELPGGGQIEVVEWDHVITRDLPKDFPLMLGLNEVVPKEASQTLIRCAGHPLLVVGEYGQGRTAAFTSDMAPHWAPPSFLEWPGYGVLWDRVVTWLSGSEEHDQSERR